MNLAQPRVVDLCSKIIYFQLTYFFNSLIENLGFLVLIFPISKREKIFPPEYFIC